jgi:hypothetical protein
MTGRNRPMRNTRQSRRWTRASGLARHHRVPPADIVVVVVVVVVPAFCCSSAVPSLVFRIEASFSWRLLHPWVKGISDRGIRLGSPPEPFHGSIGEPGRAVAAMPDRDKPPSALSVISPQICSVKTCLSFLQDFQIKSMVNVWTLEAIRRTKQWSECEVVLWRRAID